ncbi:MAG: agmatinase [Hyphomicrobiaceae bacterium]|nr:agmatinase [Hyphomicrobiaceae bacterium]
MPETLTVEPRREFHTLFDAPLVLDLDTLREIGAHVAILGLPFGSPYSMEDVNNDQANAPTAIRRAWQRALRGMERYDFDVGGALLDGRDIKIVDCGDVPGDQLDMDKHIRLSEEAVRKIVSAGCMIVSLGGDHAVPIPVFRGLTSVPDLKEPITLIQVDAHIDWRDEMNGVREGLSSTIRRASEMDHIGEIFQIGLRSAGSARPEEVEAAQAYGAHLITDMELQSRGMEAILERIPDGGTYYLTVDADGIDPTIAPAVAGPAPGGVTYPQMRTLIHGLVGKGRVLGMDVVEITPARDLNAITSVTAVRLICNLIGKAVRADYFG